MHEGLFRKTCRPRRKTASTGERKVKLKGCVAETSKRPSLGRHRRHCSVCAHPKRMEIENEFVSWRSPAAIASDYGLADRSSVYRHAHATDLFSRRQRNVRAALERIIERAGDVDATAAAVVAAVQAYSKINASGQWIERSETVSMNELFERMSTTELEAYARDGTLPAWFTKTVGATATNSREE